MAYRSPKPPQTPVLGKPMRPRPQPINSEVFPALSGKTSASVIGSFPPQGRGRRRGSGELPKRAGPGRARQRRPRARGAAGPRREDGRRRAHGEGPRGSEARTDAARSGGERDWSTARRAKPGRMRASAPPGAPEEARAIVGATSPRPTDKPNEGTKQAGKPGPAPPTKEAGRRAKTAGGSGWVGWAGDNKHYARGRAAPAPTQHNKTRRSI